MSSDLPLSEVFVVVCPLRFLDVPGDSFVESSWVDVLGVRDFYSVIWWFTSVVVVPVFVH